MLRAMLSGNPLLMLAMVGNAIAGVEDRASVGLTDDVVSGVSSDIGNINRALDNTFANNPSIFGGVRGGGSAFGGGDSTPGASSRGRSLERERTTGRAAGPV